MSVNGRESGTIAEEGSRAANRPSYVMRVEAISSDVIDGSRVLRPDEYAEVYEALLP
jgi:hypothetical protein